MKIDKKTHWVSIKNRYKTKPPKTQIVLGVSLRKENHHIIRLNHKEFGETKKWNTYTITRDGLVYQHYDPKYHTDFMGVKAGDKQSISIVFENMGHLFKTKEGKYLNWVDEY